MEQTPRLRIAFFSINDPLDKRSWSGISYYLGQTLQKNIGEVDFLGPVKIPWLLDKIMRALQKLSRFFFHSEWIPKYSLIKNLYAVWYLQRKMKGKKFDFLIAPAAASELAYLNTRVPVIYFGDATYKLYSGFYKKEFENVNSFSRWEGEHLEKKALAKSSLVILTSNWAARSAMNDYGVSAEKIRVMQFGANMDVIPERSVIYKKKQNKTLSLFFLSVDWERKGGDIAFDTLKELCTSGFSAKLIVCGCTPPPQFSHPSMEVIPFLNKNEPADFNRLVSIFSTAHFLLLPTRADCTPVVNSEANAYGIPAITTNVGGIADTVTDGVNGYCLPLEAGGKQYADLIAQVYSNSERYHQLITTSRNRFEEDLNWDSWANNFKKIITSFIVKEKTKN